jgi:broad specificity phosphatase PhoE
VKTAGVGILRYITHPEVSVEPDVPVSEWRLRELGRRRAEAMLTQPWVGLVGRIVSSAERKALETATLLADHLGLDLEVRMDTGEIDRSATGYVPYQRHEQLADRFFAHPSESADGWETAEHAQGRIVAAVADLFVDDGPCVALVGHGGVGTLLWCHLNAMSISRRHDQPGQGHYWAHDLAADRLLHGWRPIDDLES